MKQLHRTLILNYRRFWFKWIFQQIPVFLKFAFLTSHFYLITTNSVPSHSENVHNRIITLQTFEIMNPAQRYSVPLIWTPAPEIHRAHVRNSWYRGSIVSSKKVSLYLGKRLSKYKRWEVICAWVNKIIRHK